MALFWGDRLTDQARQSVRQAIAKLRRTFDVGEGAVILTEYDRVGLNREFVTVGAAIFVARRRCGGGWREC